MAKYSDIDDFIEYELLPSMFENPNKVFPEMEFKQHRGDWISNHHLNGVQDKSKKYSTYIYARTKFLIRDHATAENYELINYYMERRNCKDRLEAIDKLSGELNLTPPFYDSEKYREKRKRQEAKKTALEAFTSALWENTPEAKEVLDYLHSRTFSDEEIKQAELGLVTTKIMKSLPKSIPTQDPKQEEFFYPIGEKNTLAIPFKQGSQIIGFTVREARENPINVPTKYLNTRGVPKGSSLFGLGMGDEAIVIVEGQLDAILANLRVKDIPTVVAATGGALTKAQLETARKSGVKRVILLYDNDKAGKEYILNTKLDDKGKKIAETGSIPVCEALGIPTYVATLPEDSKDVNDFFIKGHTSKELSELINKARPSYLYRYSLVRKKYADIYDERVKAQLGKEDGEEPSLTYIERDSFLFEVGEIVNNTSIMFHAGNRELVYIELEKVKDSLLFGYEDYREYMNNEYFKKLEAKNLEDIASKRRAELIATKEKIDILLEEGKDEEARLLMGTTAESLRTQDKAAEYAKVFAPPSENDLDEMIASLPKGLPTGYCFKKGDKRESLTLKTGLTFICGLRGHGKTSFLNNIAINEVTRQLDIKDKGGEAKSVLYFSYEINKGILVKSLLNTFVNDPTLSNSPLDTIQSYFDIKTGKVTTYRDQRDELHYFDDPEKDKAHYFKDGYEGTHYNDFEREKTKFWRSYLSSGLLTIVDEPYKVEDLLDAIKNQISARPVSLVCIDYAQLLYSEAEKSKARYEEIKKIVNDIKNFANKEGLPFVLAAQFNRKEVKSPVSVDTTSIGEGGDFERIADTCIGIYNLKELHFPREDTERKDLKDFLTKNRTDINHLAKLQDLEAEQIPDPIENTLPKIQGVMYVRLMKRRYGDFPLDTFLQWEGKTGHIKQNDEAHFKTDSIVASLFTEEKKRIGGTD